MPVNAETKKYRKDNGLCERDGRPLVAGKKMCQKCLDSAAKRQEKYRQKRIKSNLCTACAKNPPVGSSRLCESCKKSNRKYARKSHIKRYNNRKQNNKCTACGKNAVDGKNQCQECLDRSAEIKRDRINRNIASGVCSQCGKNAPVDGGKRCQECIDKRNEWYQGSTTQEKDKNRREANRQKVFDHYGHCCSVCGNTNKTVLSVDHINNDGNTHRKEIGKYGSTFFKWLVDNDFPEDFQILCFNCNFEKHRTK